MNDKEIEAVAEAICDSRVYVGRYAELKRNHPHYLGAWHNAAKAAIEAYLITQKRESSGLLNSQKEEPTP